MHSVEILGGTLRHSSLGFGCGGEVIMETSWSRHGEVAFGFSYLYIAFAYLHKMSTAGMVFSSIFIVFMDLRENV